jgi:hypothetical protein
MMLAQAIGQGMSYHNASVAFNGVVAFVGFLCMVLGGILIWRGIKS